MNHLNLRIEFPFTVSKLQWEISDVEQSPVDCTFGVPLTKDTYFFNIQFFSMN